jgi:MFS transporter, DHA3 family, macrolide efflux protein
MVFLRVLRMRHLFALWISQLLSAVGNYFYEIAVMWIATKTVGGSAGIVIGAETTPMLIFGLLGGVYADRWNRRSVMVMVDVLRAGIVALLPLFAMTGRLQFWHFILIAIAIGGLGALFDPALQASLPALVDEAETLQAINGLMDITRRLARALGPSLAGVLIAVMPLPHFFTLDAVSFLISALALLTLGRRFAWKAQSKRSMHQGIVGVLREMMEGTRLMWAHRALTWALITNGIINIAWSMAFVVGVPLFAARILAGNIGAYGLIVGAYGVGNVISNIVVSTMVVRQRIALVFLGKIVVGAGFLFMAAATSLPVAMMGAAVAALGGPMEDIMMLIMIQTEISAAHTGKLYSLRMVFSSVGASLGFVLAIPAFRSLSIPLTIELCAALFLVTGVVGCIRFRKG